MKKDYKNWHKRKETINESTGSAFFQEREIWWCTLGENIGSEQDGGGELFTRPVIILAKFNLNSCLIIPLTAKPKKGKYYFSIGKVEEKEAVAIISQIRFVDRKRLELKIGVVPQEKFQKLVEKIKEVIFDNT